MVASSRATAREPMVATGADFFDPEYAHLVPKVSGIRFNQAMIDTVVLLFIAIAYLLEQGRMKRA